MVFLLAGCQTRPAPPPEAMRAACMSQAYLRTNGFLNSAPPDPKGINLLTSDLRYEEDGVMNFPKLLAERRGRFARKLRGVWTTPDHTKYLVVYGPIDEAQQCVGITEKFGFAYMRSSCAAAGEYEQMRERDLAC
jgi:hypothetical protein